jgi:predicted nucleic acid-binding protein
VIVVDAAAVVDALTGVEGSADMRALLRDEELHAPALLDYEVVSALRGLTRGGRLSAARARDVLTDLEDLPVRRWSPHDALRRRAFELRDVVPSYDAAYVVLAEALECALLTRDARLSRAVSGLVPVLVR